MNRWLRSIRIAVTCIVLAGVVWSQASSPSSDGELPPKSQPKSVALDVGLLSADLLNGIITPEVAVFVDPAPSVLAQLQQIANTDQRLTSYRTRYGQLTSDQAELSRTSDELKQKVANAERRFQYVSDKHREKGNNVVSAGLAQFKQPTPTPSTRYLLEGEFATGDVLGRYYVESTVESYQASSADKRDASDNLAELNQQQSEVVGKLNIVAVERDQLSTTISETEKALHDLRTGIVSQLALSSTSGLAVPLVVVDAYYRAQRTSETLNPSCGVRWYQLAGVGRAETHHGTFNGAEVQLDGLAAPSILGPELNGDKFAAISDSDGGELDGNPNWDHAVGPMQFIPQSWQRFGADGNGDGRNDPHNMYDAALAAAKHLCGSASQLDQEANFRRALFGYNRSTVYGNKVMSYASGYASDLRGLR